ncbi:NAD+ synthase [Taibaiella lutea]|uniref:Glutamine-dependent NAD(+) synthetase n=1 Tax=Taibaiella lutea TaxID=2608001 RepID=A0A5M6CK27_9BACT|nr:NAD+ synthase [Taibaiella lutea]KAA5533469.1 NAD+ synthase [Taibaiella lutea]
MKIYIAQQNYHIGNFEANTQKIIDAIKAAKAKGGDLIVFSELAVCGYPPRDFLEFTDFIERCNQSIRLIAAEADTIGVLVGAPSVNERVEGKDLFNSAYFLYEKEIKQIVHKTLLPNYDVFDEYRYFEPAFDWNIVEFKGRKLAVTICEDIWDVEENAMYRLQPMDMLMQQQPEIMINLSASPFDYTHAEDRLAIINKNVQRYKLPIIYCNTVGSQTEIVFDGGSLVADSKGNVVKEMASFKEELSYVTLNGSGGFEESVIRDFSALPAETLNPSTFQPELNIGRIYDALVMGIREYFEKMGFKRAIVASSGGIDSAVTLALACAALGAENVHALLLPSQYSTGHSVSDAEALSRNLNNPYDIVPIKDIFGQVEGALKPIFKDLPFNIAEENIQSRIRGLLAMALSNKFGYILLNTSNKSELATGYGTLYGDMAGGLGVLGDLYKMQVYALARYINKDKEIIPVNIIDKAPSAELRPDQKDSDSLPPYEDLDAVLYQYIEHRQSTPAIVKMGFEEAMVSRILRMVNMNEYKRNQFCPIIRISPKAFGVGRRIPIVAKYLG